MKKFLLILVSAFLLNVIWENLHVFLYMQYMGGPITEMILLRASIVDAIIISVIALPFIALQSLKKYSWTIIFLGVAIAVGIEWWALGSGRWEYNMYMPVIPLINVGVTPAIQLGLLGYVSLFFSRKFASNKI